MKITKLLLIGLCTFAAPGFAGAQEFPDRPIKLIVPFPAGGPNDIIARTIAQKMADILMRNPRSSTTTACVAV